MAEVADSGLQALTLKADTIGQSVDAWNAWMLIFLLVAAVGAVGALITTRMVVVRSRELAQVQSDLLKAKDEQLARDLREKDERIAEAQARAAEADLARAQLENRLGPRRISPEALPAFIAALAPFRGLHVSVNTTNANAEAKAFAADLLLALQQAGLDAKFATRRATGH